MTHRNSRPSPSVAFERPAPTRASWRESFDLPELMPLLLSPLLSSSGDKRHGGCRGA
jgi:hypothetical protein